MKYWILALLACGLCLVNVWHSYHDVQAYGGTDLRVRVVGARALVRGINPYTIRDSGRLDAELRDPDQQGMNRCTYPPTLLFLYAPLSVLKYPSQRVIWAVLEWCAFFTSVGVLSACIKSREARYWFLVSAIGLIGSSFFWRLHVERGQYYVFVVLLISIGMLLLLKPRHAVAAGVFWGLAICLRPTVVLLLVPWFTGKQRKVAVTAIATATVAVAAATIAGQPEYWLDFLKLSRAWELSLLEADLPSDLEVSQQSESGWTDDDTAEPTDGYNSAMLGTFAANLTFDSLSQSLQTMSGYFVNPVVMAWLAKCVWLIVAAVIWTLSSSRRKQATVGQEHQLQVGVCLMLVTDYFLPIRIEYADVMFLIPMALLMPFMICKEYRILAVTFVVAMLIPLTPINSLPFNAAAPAAMLRSCLVVYLLVRFAIVSTKPGLPVGPAPATH